MDISWPVIWTHQPHMTIGPRKFKSCSNLVHVSFKESEDPGESPSAMTPLVVVVVDENKSAKSCHKIPAFAKVFQVRQLLSRVLAYHISQIHAILELCYPTEFKMKVNSVYGLRIKIAFFRLVFGHLIVESIWKPKGLCCKSKICYFDRRNVLSGSTKTHQTKQVPISIKCVWYVTKLEITFCCIASKLQLV